MKKNNDVVGEKEGKEGKIDKEAVMMRGMRKTKKGRKVRK